MEVMTLTEMYLTAYNGAFLGPIAKGLGWIMDKIYAILSIMHIDSVPLAIVIFTIFIYICLFPLTYKQQKFSILSQKMQPEMRKIQAKYKDKRSDQAAMAAMNEETQALYDKYGISPMGSCVQIIIQMPILFALYRVFYNIPAYLTSIKSIFDKMTALISDASVKNIQNVTFNGKGGVSDQNHIIDVLYKLSDDGWNIAADKFSKLGDVFESTHTNLQHVNSIFGLNLSDTPWNIMQTSWGEKAFGIVILALLFPLCSYVSQVINMKIAQTNMDSNDPTSRQMRTMNLLMPFMSLFISFTVPLGLTVYWIAGAVVRSIQQAALNKHFDKIDLDSIIEKNKDKAAKKQEQRGIRRAQIYNAANMNTKNTLSSKASSVTDNADKIQKANELRRNAKSGSLSSKANLVNEFNNRNTKK